jgi:hypothetical protein
MWLIPVFIVGPVVLLGLAVIATEFFDHCRG